MKNIQLLIIDPQFDFCDPKGSLFVPGADSDAVRLGDMINRLEGKINDIHITLDSHNEVDIAHPIFWINSKSKHPDPFTIISFEDVKSGLWRATNPSCQVRAKEYVEALESNQRYPLCIWPPHCLIGTAGAAVVAPVAEAAGQWCRNRFKKIDFVTKGSNIFTEHYSAVKADVPDPSDPSTMLNTDLLNMLADADEIPISGQALSHCVANTVSDIADNFGEDNIKKFVLLEDTCSNVPGFDSLGVDFVNTMVKRGMRVSDTASYIA